MDETNEDLPVYCICKSPDIDRFMIMCDQCEEWFHGDCIDITEKEAKYIKYFYCKVCRSKNSSLKIKYRKNKKKEKDAQERKHEKLKKMKMKKRKSETSGFSKSSSTLQLSTESSNKLGKYEKDDLWKPETVKKSYSEKKSNFKITSDSDDEVERLLQKPSEFSQPKHQTATQIQPKHQSAAEIIPDELEKSATKIKRETDVNDKKNTTKDAAKKPKKESKRCGTCENCLRKENCGRCDVCYDRERFGGEIKLQKCRLRRCLYKKSSKLKKKEKHSKEKPLPVTIPVKVETPKKTKVKTHSFDAYAPQSSLQTGLNCAVDFTSTDQCFGPGCTNTARYSSKYCSDECGRKLARARLYHILPQRIQEWNSTSSIANEQGRAELERIRKRMEQAKNELTALEMKFRKLESIIAAGKALSIEEKRSDADDDGEAESDHAIYCVVCGHSVSLKSAIKHMDKCYIKIESLMSFGSVYPTRIEGSQRLFCDAFNEQQQTYCKRLQVLCPEHTKEPRVTEDEVCGCPLSCYIYDSKPPCQPSHFCRQAKRKCNKHFKWETMYRAEVDLQRIRQWLKIDEIFDEERRIKTAMSNRAGVVSLLLHQTVCHDQTCSDMRTKPTVSKKPFYRMVI